MSSALRVGIAAVALYVYYLGLRGVLLEGPPHIARAHGGAFMFLTNLGVAVSALHQALALVAALTGLRTAAAAASLALQVSAPLEVLIGLLYGGLRLYNPALVLDPRFGFQIRPALDRQLHLWPAVLQGAAAVFAPGRPWRAGAVAPLLIFAATAAGYWRWVHTTYAVNGFFPYPIFELLPPPQRAALFAASTLVAYAVYKLLQALQRAVHGGAQQA